MLYMNLFANWDERVRRSLFVGVVIILSFLIYPMKKGSSKKNSDSDLRYYPYGTRSRCLLLFRI